jgi:enoyl-CoA hydratase/carnithine racemase
VTQLVAVENAAPHVTALRLNRPDRLNALNYPLVAKLHDALDVVAGNDECRVVVLTGAGRAFCAGLDLRDYGMPPEVGAHRHGHAGVSGQGFLANLTQQIGAAHAFDLILTGRTVDAAEAERVGLVSRVYGEDDLEADAFELAEQVAAYTAFGLRRTKEVLWHSLDASSLAAAIAMENRNQELAVHEPEVVAYMQTYAQRHQR